MSKKLNILFVPIDGIGHMNAAIGMAEVLIESGHNVKFAINDQWKGRLIKYGIEEIHLTLEDRPSEEDPAKHWANLFFNGGAIKSGSTLETTINIRTKLMPIFAQQQKELDKKVEQLIKVVKPDVIILDQVLSLPSVELSGIPWVLVCSFNPLMFIDDERTPPWGSGYPSEGHQLESKKYRDAFKEANQDWFHDWNSYLISRGLEPVPNCYRFAKDSKWLNIYGLPLELDYLDIRPLPPKWYRFDNLKRNDKQIDFEIPEQLRHKSGKLVYFSMGSMGGADVPLMKRLVAILSKSSNRFIVSKGPLHEEYDLPDNMWGQQTVPQIQVLSVVDLVITHGGNNTVTETFFFGKPMIVMPLFSDQNDNAQRIHEKGFGIRLTPYSCTETQLLNAIEVLLNDKELNQNLKNISERIQTDNSIGKLPLILENLVNSGTDLKLN